MDNEAQMILDQDERETIREDFRSKEEEAKEKQ